MTDYETIQWGPSSLRMRATQNHSRWQHRSLTIVKTYALDETQRYTAHCSILQGRISCWAHGDTLQLAADNLRASIQRVARHINAIAIGNNTP